MASNGKIKRKRSKKQLAEKPAVELVRPPVLSQLKVIEDSYHETTREPDTDDSWDRGNTTTSWYVNGLRLSRDGDYSDVTADFEVKEGDKLYLIYAIYSTGNSFGYDTNKCIEYITVHKDESVARANEKALNSKSDYRDKKGGYDWNVNIQTDSGIVMPYHVPWLGYFEQLTGIYVEEFTVEAARN